jgi:hypothetical protein
MVAADWWLFFIWLTLLGVVPTLRRIADAIEKIQKGEK